MSDDTKIISAPHFQNIPLSTDVPTFLVKLRHWAVEHNEEKILEQARVVLDAFNGLKIGKHVQESLDLQKDAITWSCEAISKTLQNLEAEARRTMASDKGWYESQSSKLKKHLDQAETKFGRPNWPPDYYGYSAYDLARYLIAWRKLLDLLNKVGVRDDS